MVRPGGRPHGRPDRRCRGRAGRVAGPGGHEDRAPGVRAARHARLAHLTRAAGSRAHVPCGMTGADRLLVSVESLAAELASGPGPALLDVRWRLGGPPGIDSYRQGHLPGAVFTDLDKVLAAPPGPAGRHPLPDPEAFQAAMRAAGVGPGRSVVVYDDGDSMAAARGWWVLRYYGHQDVRVLDGGYRAWLSAGLAVTTPAPAPTPAPGPASGDFTARP